MAHETRPVDLPALTEDDFDYDPARMRKEYAPPRQEKIGAFTIVCLIFNRSIGSGIFATPRRVIAGTDSVGVNLLLWVVGGVLCLCGVLVWTEFGLSTPREVVEGRKRAVPRSGGEKNYLEWVLQKPAFLATCMYGIVFLILGNLSGNAVIFGRYVLLAAGQEDPKRGPVIGIAIAALIIITMLHALSRRGGILMNNIFAVMKVCILLLIIILGIIVRAGADTNSRGPRPQGVSLTPNDTFKDAAKGLASYSTTFLYVLFTYSGFEQPFYVLSEVDRPRRNFPRAVIPATIAMTTLFVLVNLAYVFVVPMTRILDPKDKLDLASMFFEEVFGNPTAKRTMQAFIALSIMGNLIVMTFTAARVKQEIAKEGILPKSLLFATANTTPTAKLLAKMTRRKGEVQMVDGQEHLEQSPMAALGLHLVTSIFLIAVTAKLKPDDQYSFLVSLYAYVIMGVMGFATSLGLLFSKYVRKDFKSEYKVWGGPTAATIYCVVNAFVLITAFLKPPESLLSHGAVPHYVVPSVGLSTCTWGLLWWLGLHFVMKQRGQRLSVTRSMICEKVDDDGEWVLQCEIIDHVWRADSYAGSDAGSMRKREREGGNFEGSV